MTAGRKLRPEKAVRAAHEWVRALLLHGLKHHFPTQNQRAVYSEAALVQIREVVEQSIDAYLPSAPRRAEWD